MISLLVGEMPEAHRRFLLSCERGEPNLNLLASAGAEHLPAVSWSQKILARLSQSKRDPLVEALEAVSQTSSAGNG